MLAVKDAPDVPFEGLFGDSSQLRLIEKLLAMPSFEFSKSELAQIAGISRPSVYRALRLFEQWNFVRRLRRGKRIRYQLDVDSPLVIALYDVNHALLMNLAGFVEEEIVLGEETFIPKVETAYAMQSSGRLVMVEKPMHTGKALQTASPQIGVA